MRSKKFLLLWTNFPLRGKFLWNKSCKYINFQRRHLSINQLMERVNVTRNSLTALEGHK